MKITINTKEDSHEDIKKVIRMLNSLIGKEEIMSNRDIFGSEGTFEEPATTETEPSETNAQSAFGAMFGAPSAAASNSTESETEAAEPQEETPEISEYY